ncbi:hypothetical protein N7456_007543 [Penicillium angulare]|uniref:Uncharacterized protein n=1 Tax=Penicillium angulare TaxID=116970 RepID=A0A9W9FAV5_9EURO|nr:hypothetical protein N7456_007543 [Penicillium angulare]
MLPFAYLMTYAVPMLLTFTSPSFPTVAWEIAHIFLPIAAYLLKRIVGLEPNIDMVRKDEHVKSLKRFIKTVSTLQLGGLLVLEKPLVWRLITFFSSGQNSTFSVTDARIIVLEIAIALFIAFAHLDMRRVLATELEFPWAVVYGGAISLLTSPAITLLVFWAFRESEWANASRKG